MLARVCKFATRSPFMIPCYPGSGSIQPSISLRGVLKIRSWVDPVQLCLSLRRITTQASGSDRDFRHPTPLEEAVLDAFCRIHKNGNPPMHLHDGNA